MDDRRRELAKKSVAVLALLFLVNQLVPGIGLVLIPHEGVERPDPRREPLQENVDGAPQRIERRRGRDLVVVSRARYDIAAEVVGRDHYRAGVDGALIPWDLVLAWGKLVDPPYRSKIDYLKTSRFYNWSTGDGSLDLGYIGSHSANVHLIPGSSRIGSVLARVRTGNTVRLEGDLVDITGPDSFSWRTSLTRSDSGPGACETIYVTAITVGGKRYR